MDRTGLKVISASRRIDMVAGEPERLVQILRAKCPPARVHSLVLWTKNASNVLNHASLTAELERYDQLYLQYSITGLGGTVLEPMVPSMNVALSHLAPLIRFLKNPRRLRIRFDPIVHFRLPNDEVVCNLPLFAEIAKKASKLGVRDVSTSWVIRYPKVDSRLRQKGIFSLEVSQEQLLDEANWMQRIAGEYGLQLHGCCVPQWPTSRCIDGYLLNELHPKGYRASVKRAKGQRALCGCTESWDIGWYNPCFHGCVYCYGNPKPVAPERSKGASESEGTQVE